MQAVAPSFSCIPLPIFIKKKFNLLNWCFFSARPNPTNHIGTFIALSFNHRLDVFNQNLSCRYSMISFDFRKALIPFSLLRLSNAFQGMKPGDAIEVIADDASIAADLRLLLPKSGDIVICSQVMDDMDGDEPAVRFKFKKK